MAVNPFRLTGFLPSSGYAQYLSFATLSNNSRFGYFTSGFKNRLRLRFLARTSRRWSQDARFGESS